MLFRVYEQYNDDYEDIFQEQCIQCFICFEYKNNFENKPTSLRKQLLYFSNCNCDGNVHNNCLQLWLDNNKSCPICRNSNIIENKNVILILKFMPFGIQIYSFSKKLSLRFVRFLAVMIIFYLSIYFYLLVVKTKYVPYDNYTYTPIPILEDEYCNKTNQLLHP